MNFLQIQRRINEINQKKIKTDDDVKEFSKFHKIMKTEKYNKEMKEEMIKYLMFLGLLK